MKEPFIANSDCDPNVRSCPNFNGKKKIKGWKLIDEHFVDKSGWGASDEPALTPSQFIKLIKKRAWICNSRWRTVSSICWRIYKSVMNRGSYYKKIASFFNYINK